MSMEVEPQQGSLISWTRPSRQRDGLEGLRTPRNRRVQISTSAPSSPPDRYCISATKTQGFEEESRQGEQHCGLEGRAANPASKSCPASPTGPSHLSSPRVDQAGKTSSTGSPVPARKDANAPDLPQASSPEEDSTSSFVAPQPSLKKLCQLNSSASPMGNLLSRAPKRPRALHDVDGPGTGHLSCKKRRLRLMLITSRLSLPFSLPATHILNRESGEDTPVLSRFLKMAALGAKKVGHQSALVRKAAILNRVRLNVRQAAVNRGHERMYRMASTEAMGHGVQLVTAATGAMFPGRGITQSNVPPGWRPHTTGTTTMPAGDGRQLPWTHPSGFSPGSSAGPQQPPHLRPPPAPRLVPVRSPDISPVPSPTLKPTTSIMAPLPDDGDSDGSAFPSNDMDSKYVDLSDDDMDDVYADFEVLFGGRVGSPESGEEGEHFYEEYLDELDGLPWVS